MSELYLDTEFNGHGGKLLSLAIANTSGKHFYARFSNPPQWHEWVAEHVVPHFDIEPEDDLLARFRLREYLLRREPVTIYADWPADFMYLTDLMCGAAFSDSWMVDCQMVLLRNTEPKPEKPHNALSDAVALMDWHQKLLSQGGYKSAVATWAA